MWKEEILSRVETKEERKSRFALYMFVLLLNLFDRIMERAHALKNAREKERQDFVKQCYDNRWRDACDDARTLDSRALETYVNQERQLQIQEKIRRKQAINAEESAFLQQMMHLQAEEEERERRKNEEGEFETKTRASAIVEQVTSVN